MRKRDNCNYRVSSIQLGESEQQATRFLLSITLGQGRVDGSPLRSPARRPSGRSARCRARGRRPRRLPALLERRAILARARRRSSVLADCLALAGAPLSACRVFSRVCGAGRPGLRCLASTGRWSALIVADCLPDLASGSATAAAIARGLGQPPRCSSAGNGPRRGGHRPRCATRSKSAMTVDKADVGTALIATGHPPSPPPWPLARAGARNRGRLARAGRSRPAYPALLTRSGLTSTALPCLTGLTRAMRYTTLSMEDLELALWTRLGEQARHGLSPAAPPRSLCPRLARAPRRPDRPEPGRPGGGAVPDLAGLHAPTAGGRARGHGGRCRPPARHPRQTRTWSSGPCSAGPAFYVAPESLGDFKLVPRQGRHPALPIELHLPTRSSAFDAELAAFDLLGLAIDLAGIDHPAPARENPARTDISP